MKYALIKNTIVENLIQWDGDAGKWSPPEGYDIVRLDDAKPVDLGWIYSGRVFRPPTPQEMAAYVAATPERQAAARGGQ